ncbi:unnamed protein product [Ranitomeya imitator]|uniref:Integrase catalytic domain-containing protein n=1 Tax=Ranitomeya imitator TaxID=111125 RepID=A0ABN9L7T4_9NEOB|nr:unnamed protein product [Ranitomeya imitator]
MAHFIPLSGLPSAPELAKIFIRHIFRLHGFPLHIVSDQGVQFTARFWRALCGLMKSSQATQKMDIHYPTFQTNAKFSNNDNHHVMLNADPGSSHMKNQKKSTENNCFTLWPRNAVDRESYL